jgi:hypothetical protein
MKRSLGDPMSREKSWAWWCRPVIPMMVGSMKCVDHGPGWPEQKLEI